MIITVLGSGTCVPSLRRSTCSFLLEIGNEKLLFDLGSGTIRRLLESGTRISDISTVFFSHFHPDHTGELASFLFSSKYDYTSPRKFPLNLVGGSGIHFFFESLKSVYQNWIILEAGLFNIRELSDPGEWHDFGSFKVKTAPVKHNAESVAFRIENRTGNSLVYSGDTDYCNALIDIADKADILICESSFPDGMKIPGHLTPSLAGAIAAKAEVRHLLLTHFYPACDGIDIVGQCRQAYAGPLKLAEDLLKIDLESGIWN